MKRIDQWAPELDKVIDPRAAIHDLADGFGGAQGPAEGPLWWAEGAYDREGNVYCGGAGGIWIFDAGGGKLGRIVHGAPATTNVAFGGPDWKTLYFTSRSHLGAVDVKIPGVPVPVPKR
jgi:sugar lactone lactonase YvrE